MALLTEAEVRQRAQASAEPLRKSPGQTLDEVARADSAEGNRFDVFLSHSSSESSELLLGIFRLL